MTPETEKKMEATLAEWSKIILEIEPIMEDKIVEHDRVKDCTLLEQWRMEQGMNPFDSDNDYDSWKATREIFENDVYLVEYYKDILNQCGIDEGVLKLKYPRVAKVFAANSSTSVSVSV